MLVLARIIRAIIRTNISHKSCMPYSQTTNEGYQINALLDRFAHIFTTSRGSPRTVKYSHISTINYLSLLDIGWSDTSLANIWRMLGVEMRTSYILFCKTISIDLCAGDFHACMHQFHPVSSLVCCQVKFNSIQFNLVQFSSIQFKLLCSTLQREDPSTDPSNPIWLPDQYLAWSIFFK